ncbi:spr1630 family ClpXP-sensitive toxin [Lactovum odontotermitis]
MAIFTAEQGQAIVDNILTGYNSYLQERLTKKREMAVSDGYAWTRSNHIDDAFAKANLDFIEEYTKDRAGESWGYLKFTSPLPELGKVLLLIKNGYRLNQTFSPTKSSEYLVELSKISDDFVAKWKSGKTTQKGNIQLDLFSLQNAPNLLKAKAEFSEFFVIVYETDVNKQINHIAVTVLDSIERIIQEVQDLSEYIHSSIVAPIQDEEIQELVESTDVELPVFPYEIPEKEQEAN